MSNPHESNGYGDTDRNKLNTSTLYVKSLAGELKRDDVLGYFSAFGDVKNVRICAFVEFTQAESVTKALESNFHTIAGRRVEVTIADGDRLETKFLDLNDDCIHGILSTECLSALDLCSVAETCRRFKDIAGRVFRRKYAKCNMNSLANFEVKSAQRILRNFGGVMSDLEISGLHFRYEGKSVLDSVANHCGDTLESLCLRGCVIPDNFRAKLKSIFSNLQKLRIDDCRFTGGASKELFADCDSLVELELYGRDVGFIVENTFPKLQKYNSTNGAADVINLPSFILRHKNLTSIGIDSYLGKSSLLPIIGANCKQLEELEFCIYGDETFDLSSLGHLRKLNIFFDNLNAMEVARGWNKLQFLEDLTLQCAKVDAEFFQTLSQLRRLQVLRLWHCDGLENLLRIGDSNQLKELEILTFKTVNLDVVALLKRLRNLKALSVRAKEFKFDLQTYLRIVDVVRARPDKSKLTLKLKSFYRRQQCDADMLKSFSLNAEMVEIIIEK